MLIRKSLPAIDKQAPNFFYFDNNLTLAHNSKNKHETVLYLNSRVCSKKELPNKC